MNKPTTRPPTAHIAPFGVRMQPELKERLEQAAQQSGRSLNAELVARLERSFDTPETAVLLSAFSRVEYALAQVELEKVSERARTAVFAVHLRDVCERLLPIASDKKTEQELQQWIKEANGVIHGVSQLESEFSTRLDKVREAVQNIQPLAPGVAPIGSTSEEKAASSQALRVSRKPPQRKG